jgi:tRNA modification GTPase
VEISCHGSPVVVRQLIDLTLIEGARLAGPGEFSLRALANGKISLAQAEAIRDLIQAQTQAAAKQAALQLSGELSAALAPLKSKLVDVIVVLESALEFVEDDLPPTQVEQIENGLQVVKTGVDELRLSYQAGRLLSEGFKAAILGQPNVGKSTLFNKLVGRDRAIVTDIPGTTRDTLSEAVDINGVPVILTDTAGLRESPDGIETLGIQRAHQAASEADLLITVFDGTRTIGPDECELLSQTASRNRLLVINKCDLEGAPVSSVPQELHAAVHISAKTGEGINALRDAIIQMFGPGYAQDGGLVVTNARHHDLLCRVMIELDSALEAVNVCQSEELILAPLHNALSFLGEITGETTPEQILSEIFATFCIGK